MLGVPGPSQGPKGLRNPNGELHLVRKYGARDAAKWTCLMDITSWTTSLGCRCEHCIHVLIRTKWAPSPYIAPCVFTFISQLFVHAGFMVSTVLCPCCAVGHPIDPNVWIKLLKSNVQFGDLDPWYLFFRHPTATFASSLFVAFFYRLVASWPFEPLCLLHGWFTFAIPTP